MLLFLYSVDSTKQRVEKEAGNKTYKGVNWGQYQGWNSKALWVVASKRQNKGSNWVVSQTVGRRVA